MYINLDSANFSSCRKQIVILILWKNFKIYWIFFPLVVCQLYCLIQFGIISSSPPASELSPPFSLAGIWLSWIDFFSISFSIFHTYGKVSLINQTYFLLFSYPFHSHCYWFTEIENDVEKENQKNRQNLWKTSVQAMRLCHVCILFSLEKLNGNEEDYYDYYRNDGI